MLTSRDDDEARTMSVLWIWQMLELLRVANANGDFHNKLGLRVAVILGVTGVVCRLESAVSTSVEKSIVLVTGAVNALVAAVVILAALVIARERLSERYVPRVNLAQVKLGSSMLSIKQSKTNMVWWMSLSDTMTISTTRRKLL
jgi:Na+-transporting NADH:ubiquinone oxidoreductase subunit NqrE